MEPGTGNGTQGGAAGERIWRFRGRSMRLCGRIRVVGIVNVTPDSFSDGGAWATPEAATARVCALLDEGADAVDIGGESTRPGAVCVGEDEEAARVVPVIRAVRAARPDAVLFVDSRKARVAALALAAGADVVNDVSGLRDPGMAEAVREAGAGLVLMHMRGDPATMQENPVYGDVVGEVCSFLEARLAEAVSAGIPADCVVLDPGIGFGKTLAHNRALLQGVDALRRGGRPLLYGVSRKRLLGEMTGRPVGERDAGSLALLAWLAMRGADLIRVHDVKASIDAARVLATMMEKEPCAHGLV